LETRGGEEQKKEIVLFEAGRKKKKTIKEYDVGGGAACRSGLKTKAGGSEDRKKRSCISPKDAAREKNRKEVIKTRSRGGPGVVE